MNLKYFIMENNNFRVIRNRFGKEWRTGGKQKMFEKI